VSGGMARHIGWLLYQSTEYSERRPQGEMRL